MKLSGSVGIGILSLILGIPAVMYAQDEPKQEAKPEPKQEETRPPKAEQSKPEQPRPEQVRPEANRQDDMKPPAQDEAKTAKQDKQQEKQDEKQQKEQQMKPSHQSGSNARPAGKSARIPDEKFHSSFGRSHTFVVQRTTVSQGQQGFAYGGYSFVFVDPWPAEWAYTDDCYVDYVDGEYVLIDLAHPGITIALTVVL